MTIQLPIRCKRRLDRRKIFLRAYPAIADRNLGFPIEDWLDQVLDILGLILVVGICVHDDIRPKTQTGIQTGGKASCQPGMLRQMHDVMNAVLTRHLRGAVRAAVVDHQVFKRVNALQLARQRLQGVG